MDNRTGKKSDNKKSYTHMQILPSICNRMENYIANSSDTVIKRRTIKLLQVGLYISW